MLSPTRRLFQYKNSLSRSYKLKAFISPKMTDIITFIDNNVNLGIYTGETSMEYIIIWKLLEPQLT